MRVIIESPFGGELDRNIKYLWRCVRDSIERGEAPFASHGFYPAVLNETLLPERELGIKLGYEWMEVATVVAFYIDYGWSPGMKKAYNRAKKLEKPIVRRKIGRNP